MHLEINLLSFTRICFSSTRKKIDHAKKKLNYRSRRHDRFRPKIIEIGAILAIFNGFRRLMDSMDWMFSMDSIASTDSLNSVDLLGSVDAADSVAAALQRPQRLQWMQRLQCMQRLQWRQQLSEGAPVAASATAAAAIWSIGGLSFHMMV